MVHTMSTASLHILNIGIRPANIVVTRVRSKSVKHIKTDKTRCYDIEGTSIQNARL